MGSNPKQWRITLEFQGVDGETAESAVELLDALIAGNPWTVEEACFKRYRVLGTEPAGAGELCPECKAHPAKGS